MLPLSRILVPVDFSPQCCAMLLYASTIAKRYSAELTLLHVVNPIYAVPATGLTGPTLFPVPQSTIAEENERMADFGANELKDTRVRRLVYEGDPVEQIAGFVESEAIQLIVMSTHGHGVLRRFLLGSITAKVLHDVACPVFTGAHMDPLQRNGNRTFTNVLCALDLGAQSEETLMWASKFAADFLSVFERSH
jgi:nucleotide-binding universal stress UspA family protein